MQIEMNQKGLLMSGKAWQIRARLREWSKHSLTLQEFLSRHQRKPHQNHVLK